MSSYIKRCAFDIGELIDRAVRTDIWSRAMDSFTEDFVDDTVVWGQDRVGRDYIVFPYGGGFVCLFRERADTWRCSQLNDSCDEVLDLLLLRLIKALKNNGKGITPWSFVQ